MVQDAKAELVRASVLSQLATRLERFGHHGTALLRRFGVTSAQIEDHYSLIPLAVYANLFEAAAEMLDDPALGFRLGSEIEPKSLGPMGFLMLSQPTIGEALACVVRHIDALQGGTTNTLEVQGDVAVFDYRLNNPAIWPRRQDAEFSLSVVLTLMRKMRGPAWAPLALHFEHARGEKARHIAAMVKAPVSYGESSNRLILSLADLALSPTWIATQRPLGADIAPYIERHLADLQLRNGENALAERVGQAIDRLLGRRSVTVALVAGDLGVPVRSLQRALGDDGCSFSRILAQRRQALGQRLLDAGEMGLEDIALELGYADATAFIRAYRCWTGSTPRRRGGTAPA